MIIPISLLVNNDTLGSQEFYFLLFTINKLILGHEFVAFYVNELNKVFEIRNFGSDVDVIHAILIEGVFQCALDVVETCDRDDSRSVHQKRKGKISLFS